MDLDALAVRVVLLRKLQEKVHKAVDDAREELRRALGPEGRKIAKAHDYRLATTYVTKDRAQINHDALLGWVKRCYPEEVEVRTETITTEQIRPAFLDAIKKATERAGIPCAPDGTCDLPGVSITPGYLAIRAAEGSDEAIEHLWQAGLLSRVDLGTNSILEIE